MSDDRLRELERRFRQTNALDDEVSWLHELQRTGRLAPDRLEVAAAAGNVAAARLVGHDCAASFEPCFRCWPEVAALHRVVHLGGAPVALRATIGAARVALARLEEEPALLDPPSVVARIRVRVQAFVTRRSTWIGVAQDARAVVEAAEASAMTGADPGATRAAWGEAEVRLRRLSANGVAVEWAYQPLHLALGWLDQPTWSAYFQPWLTTERLVGSVAEDLVPWALGREDPVAARLTAARGPP